MYRDSIPSVITGCYGYPARYILLLALLTSNTTHISCTPARPAPPTEHLVPHYRSPVQLNCSVASNSNHGDIQVTWLTPTGNQLSGNYSDGNLATHGHSLTVLHVMPEHLGDYVCAVETAPGGPAGARMGRHVVRMARASLMAAYQRRLQVAFASAGAFVGVAAGLYALFTWRGWCGRARTGKVQADEGGLSNTAFEKSRAVGGANGGRSDTVGGASGGHGDKVGGAIGGRTAVINEETWM